MDGFLVFVAVSVILAATFVGIMIMKGVSRVAVATGYTPF